MDAVLGIDIDGVCICRNLVHACTVADLQGVDGFGSHGIVIPVVDGECDKGDSGTAAIGEGAGVFSATRAAAPLRFSAADIVPGIACFRCFDTAAGNDHITSLTGTSVIRCFSITATDTCASTAACSRHGAAVDGNIPAAAGGRLTIRFRRGAANTRTIRTYGRYTAPVDGDSSAAADDFLVRLIDRSTSNARARRALSAYNTTVNGDGSADALRSTISTNTRSISAGSSRQCARISAIAINGQARVVRHVEPAAVITAFQAVLATRSQSQIELRAAFYSKGTAVVITAHINLHPVQGDVGRHATHHHDFIRS